MQEIPKTYDANKVEDRIYKLWEKSGFFNPDVCVAKKITKKTAKPFCMVLPPPNVTGTLHMGHAAMLAIEDIMVRYHRMNGEKTLWIPGTDHAAIATESKVEDLLYKKEGKTRHDLGREEFLTRVEQFAKESHDTIVRQIRKMGASLDWSREAYTLDEQRSLAVRTAFKRMYDAGLIYQGERIVNWDPKLQTTVSDDEIEWKDETTNFYYLKYGPFTIATARPETKFGDKYVVMHPKDARYKNYTHGQTIQLEWINGPVTATVIKDEAVDIEFGTGVMTITPWHDAVDFEIAERHNLDKQHIIDLKGKLLPIAGEFAGIHIKKARPLIVEKLRAKGLVEKIEENYAHRVATNSRGGGLIEPQIMRQWFINVHAKFKDTKQKKAVTLKELMIQAVRGGQIKILPKRFEKVYYHWIENLRDWCISRQIWFGHQVPVWYCGGIQKSLQLKMGFHKDVIPQVFKGKTKTYRLRNHNFRVGDKVLFENSQTKTYFGYGIITEIEETTVHKIDYKDKGHYKTYNNLEELIAAFKLRNPEKTVTPQSKAYLYAYEFHPFVREDATEGCGQIIASTEKPKQCPACKSAKLQQDQDTLDTWFSSGLWTFSTLGWPNKTKDLKTYHPTSVLETGYDILFFWVARMILMSTYHIDQIPFHTVYLHGLVRDAQGRKMSKSLGNIVDPLDMIQKYGADATRLSLIMGTGPGSDSKFSEDKVRGCRNFINKFWNISRFILTNLEEYRPPKRKMPLPHIEQKILAQFHKVQKRMDIYFKQLRFPQAAETMYQYLWHTFADKVIEQSKPVLQNAQKKTARQYVLLQILQEATILLHPFAPFITEEIYQQLPLPKKKQTLMIEHWPTP